MAGRAAIGRTTAADRGAVKLTLRDKFKQLWKYYLLQSLLAGVVVLVLVACLGRDKTVTIASMGASAFIVFAMPKSVSAQTRNVVGGHLVGLACGALFCLVEWSYFVEYPLVVAIAIFLMVALDVEHPPAAGTALAVVINEGGQDIMIAIILSAIVLSQCRYYMRSYLKDLV